MCSADSSDGREVPHLQPRVPGGGRQRAELSLPVPFDKTETEPSLEAISNPTSVSSCLTTLQT